MSDMQMIYDNMKSGMMMHMMMVIVLKDIMTFQNVKLSFIIDYEDVDKPGLL